MHKLMKAGRIARNFMLNRGHTYCHILWDSVFIDERGRVYNCCHKEPADLGNLHENNLSDIWNKSPVLQTYRWMSKNRCLECFSGCNILTLKQKKDPPPVQPKLSYPRRVWILYSEFCPLACTMCTQDHGSRVMIDPELLKEQIEWERVEEVELQGGEVLAIKGARALYLWLTRTAGKKVDVITNGLLVNDEWAEHLALGSSFVQISVNAATKSVHETVNLKSNFEQVIAGIERLVDQKRRHGTEVRIVYKYTIVPENLHELADAIVVADTLGCDEIAYGYSHAVERALEQDEDLRSALKAQLQELSGRDLSVMIERNRLEHLGLMTSAAAGV